MTLNLLLSILKDNIHIPLDRLVRGNLHLGEKSTYMLIPTNAMIIPNTLSRGMTWLLDAQPSPTIMQVLSCPMTAPLTAPAASTM